MGRLFFRFKLEDSFVVVFEVVQYKKPYAISVIWGVVAAIIVNGCMPVLRLGELAGPPDFALPISLIMFVMLAGVCFTARVKGFLRGVVSGALFAVPVTTACFLTQGSDRDFQREHGSELHSIGIVLFFIIIIAAGIVGGIRADAEGDLGSETHTSRSLNPTSYAGGFRRRIQKSQMAESARDKD